jgi:hypothetical protein
MVKGSDMQMSYLLEFEIYRQMAIVMKLMNL